jgi:Inorganic Pyrophosphatase
MSTVIDIPDLAPANVTAKTDVSHPNIDPSVVPSTFAGIKVNVENPKGTTRRGIGKDGKPWETLMQHSYGSIPKHNGEDGECLDCYLGPDETSADAHIVHQNDSDGNYDEDKTMLGFPTQQAAKEAYLAHVPAKHFRSMTTMPMEMFKGMLTKAEPGSAHWKKKHTRKHETTALMSRVIALSMNSGVFHKGMAAAHSGNVSHGEWNAPEATKHNAMLKRPDATGTKAEYGYPIFDTEGKLSAKGVGSALGYAKKNNETAIIGALTKISNAIKDPDGEDAADTTELSRIETYGVESPAVMNEVIELARTRLAQCPACKSHDVKRLGRRNDNEGPRDKCVWCGRIFPAKPGTLTAEQHASKMDKMLPEAANPVTLPNDPNASEPNFLARQNGLGGDNPYPETPGTTATAGFEEDDPPVDDSTAEDDDDKQSGQDDESEIGQNNDELLSNLKLSSRQAKSIFGMV